MRGLDKFLENTRKIIRKEPEESDEELPAVNFRSGSSSNNVQVIDD